jgi:hypothetical protein
VKRALERHQFQDIIDIKKNVTIKLNTVPSNISDGPFVQLLERCERLAAVKGDYFEGNYENFLLISCSSLLID